MPIAIALVLLAKWRMFAVRPRYWLIHILANGVDILVSVSLIAFMASTSEQWWQFLWVLLYALWLTVLKPRSDVLSVSAQAMLCQLLALTALYIRFGGVAVPILVLATWAITYISARHFLSSFDENRFALYAHAWAYFAAILSYILGHWLLFYGIIAQPVLILTVIGYSLAALYYLHSVERLTDTIKRQLISVGLAILALIVVLSDWTGIAV